MNGTTQPRYVTLDELRDYLSSQNTLGTTQDGLLQECIFRAESAINDYTRRNFLGTAGTYYVNRWSACDMRGPALYLDKDIHTLAGVVNGDGQTIPVGSVWLEPRNAGPPYRVLRLKSSYAWVWSTDTDVIISGTFGYGTSVPDIVKQAVIRTAAYYFRGKDSGFGPTDVAGFTEGGEVPVTQGIPQDVRWQLAPYRSRSGGAI